MQITATNSILDGEVTAIPSKSFAHRILLCAMLAEKPTRVYGCDFPSDDILATKNAVAALGCAYNNGEIIPSQIKLSKAIVDCRESGSLLRFILPILAVFGGEYDITGSEKLLSRPIDDLTSVLCKNGAKIEKNTQKIHISGQLQSGEYAIRGDVSSQFITGLLLALPTLRGNSKIKLTTPLASKKYVDITLDVMRKFGVTAEKIDDGYEIKGNQKYRPPKNGIAVEGDWSNAAFWLAGAAISGNVFVCGLNAQSLQGDKKIVDFLERMGAEVLKYEDRVSVKSRKLNAIDVDVDETIDLVPILSVLCAYADGTSVLRNINRLRFKESDRVLAILSLINSIGGKAYERENNIIVEGTGLTGGIIDSHNDHRIAMSAMIAGLGASGSITITNAQAMDKSYPGFASEYERLGGKISVNLDRK